MVSKKPKPIAYKRKRSGKTNYKKRLHLLLAKKPRLAIRLSNRKIIVQIIEFKTPGDLVRLGVDSSLLKNYGWLYSLKNLPAAYLTGYLFGKLALQKNFKEALLDIGFKSPLKGNKNYACLKGVLDAGLDIPHSEDILPSEERFSGKHIQDYASKIKENNDLYQKRFTKYLKDNLDPTKMVENFQKTKQQIESKLGGNSQTETPPQNKEQD